MDSRLMFWYDGGAQPDSFCLHAAPWDKGGCQFRRLQPWKVCGGELLLVSTRIAQHLFLSYPCQLPCLQLYDIVRYYRTSLGVVCVSALRFRRISLRFHRRLVEQVTLKCSRINRVVGWDPQIPHCTCYDIPVPTVFARNSDATWLVRSIWRKKSACQWELEVMV